MEQLVIVGGGGHAKVIIEILRDAGHFGIAGCIVPGQPVSSVLGVPSFGDDSQLPRLFDSGLRHTFVAVGDNRLRRGLAQKVLALGFKLVNAVSPRAIISPSVQLGRGIAIMPGAVVNSSSSLGSGCIINTGASVDHDCNIGDWAHIAPGTNLAGNVTVGEGAFLGIGGSVIPKISIGAWSVVGAGAVVIRDLPAAVTAVGVPARVVSRTDLPGPS